MHLKTTMLEHQQQAVEKLKGLKVGGLFMEMGTGKALPLDTLVLTPIGWVSMGDIQVGDFVMGKSGFPVKVIGVYPQGVRDVYEITFSDGAKAQCSEDHLWEVNTPLRKWRNMPSMVLSLKEIKERGIKHANGNRKFFIPLVEPVFFEQKDLLPIDPYVLGVLLGDGYLRKNSVSISSADNQIIRLVEERLPSECCVVKRGGDDSYDYDIVGKQKFKNPIPKILRNLNLAGKRAESKFIPRPYLFASAENRLEVLRGLLDTDGFADNAGIEFCTTSKQLAEDVRFLVLSLGGLAKINEKKTFFTYKGVKKAGRIAYRIYIRFLSEQTCFRLDRKRVKTRKKYNPTRSIESIEYIGRKTVQCIKVDSTDGLFVINDFIVTHNTRCLIEFAAIRHHKIDKVVVFCPVALKQTWLEELHKHVESPSVYVFDDKSRQGQIPAADWYIVGSESMGQSDRVTLAVNELVTDKTFIALDESDTCKNHRAIRTQRITAISQRAKYRMVLTGTAVGEGIADLYSQMYFLSPQILGYKSFYTFARNHLEYSEKYKGLVVNCLRTDWIAAKIDPYVFQVKKDECLSLPDKLYTTRYCSMTWEQAQLYQRAKEEILRSCPDEEINSYTIFQLFTALREIVSGFWNRYPDPHAHYWRKKSSEPPEMLTCQHDRLDVLAATLHEIPTSEKVIIWSNFQYSTNQITNLLASEYGTDSYSEYHGQTADRDRSLEQWRSEARFLVASPKCGGRGLTLVESAYQVFYNNDFPYRVREQAEARNHRIGQTRRPTYIDLVCSDSIDDRIFKSLQKKESLVQAFKRELDKLKTAKQKREKLMQL